MEIKINHQPKSILSPCSVQQLLDDVIGEQQHGIAVAVNDTVIPKASWSRHPVQENDCILVIKATQGG